MKGKGARTALLIVAIMVPCFSFGGTLSVPQDYPDITSASNAAVSGDVILVWPPPGGEWLNKTVTLKQGVTLRGMVDLNAPVSQMTIRDSHFFLLESPPSGGDDTTRMINLPIVGNIQGEEPVQVYA